MNGKVIPISLGFVNAYLLETDDGFVLADTGVSMQWPTLEKALTRAGCVPGKLKLVVITHGDMDHAGNALKLRETFKCPVAIHLGDVPAVETGVSPKRHIRSFPMRVMFAMVRLFGRGVKVMSPPLFKPDIILTDNQRLDDYGLKAITVHLPGHTKGSLAILTDSGDFIAGDVYANRKKPALSPYVENKGEYLSSIERLKGMVTGIKTVYPGHGNPFSGDLIQSIGF